MAWLMVCESAEQAAWAAGVADRLDGRKSRAALVGEDVRAFYVAGWEGVTGG